MPRSDWLFTTSTSSDETHATTRSITSALSARPWDVTLNISFDNSNTMSDTPEAKAATAFSADWHSSDATQLHPTNLQRSRPLRAWERRPASPFTRQKVRVGKVWRRTALFKSNVHAKAELDEEQRAAQSLGTPVGRSPQKAVKKLCLSSEHGVGTLWERAASPVKRIITRSARADQLVALPESDEEADEDNGQNEEDVEGTVVEILGEDGEPLDVDVEEATHEEGWSDLEENKQEEAYDDTMMHLGAATGFVSEPETTCMATYETKTDDHESQDPLVSARPLTHEEEELTTPEVHQLQLSAVSDALRPSLTSCIPEGFVSPVKQYRSVRRRGLSGQLSAGRRRTLPPIFAPADLSISPPSRGLEQLSTEIDTGDVGEIVEADAVPTLESSTSLAEDQPAADDSWEDVDEDEHLSPSQKEDAGKSVVNKGLEDYDQQAAMVPTDSQEAMPTFDFGLPVRSSPRRKSSSPFKQRAMILSDDVPHLVAFSPVKHPGLSRRLPGSKEVDFSDSLLDVDVEDSNIHMMPERSASAPPEEINTSPQKSARPRLSDDTALLQAFLNRAAENKSARRLSTAKRESLTNRRDSDTVRQALASPAKPEVLSEMDPNSPAVRKTSPGPETQMLKAASPIAGHPEDMTAGSRSGAPRTAGARRSVRERKKVQSTLPSAPNKISIRSNKEPLVLKRSEAQDLAVLTRNNTRKNKGLAILPPYRLPELAELAAGMEEPTTEMVATAIAEGVRGVRWDETLAYFQEVPSRPELLELGSSDSIAQPQIQTTTPTTDDDMAAPPPAADTPSKPRIKRLRPPRAASTPAKLPIAPDPKIEELTSSTKASEPSKPKVTKRTRIATPAKPLFGSTSLLPAADSLEAPPETKPVIEKKPLPRGKRATSRLPAPPNMSAPPTTTATSLTKTKEQQPPPSFLAASPAKKKAPGISAAMGAFAPKLEFSRTKLEALTAAGAKQDENSAGLSGFMSPAKKARKGSVFSGAESGKGDEIGGGKLEEPLGLKSPAKKRSRRGL